MAANNNNAVTHMPGRIYFNFRADYFYDPTGEEEIFDYDKLRDDRIVEIVGYPVVDAVLENQDEESEIPSTSPGLYLSVQIGENHGVSFTITEEELLKALADLQQVKVEHQLVMLYRYQIGEGEPANDTIVNL